MYQIEQITHELTWEIRQKELYPNFPIKEMGIPEDISGIHFGLFKNNQLVSITSVFDLGDSLQFRKFATLKEYQHQGLGTILLNYIIDFAKQERKSSIWCNARENAVEFYKKNGFKLTKDTFTRSGINFIIMIKDLNVYNN